MKFFLASICLAFFCLAGCCLEKEPIPTQAYLLTVTDPDSGNLIVDGRIVTRYSYNSLLCPRLYIKGDIDSKGQVYMRLPEVGYHIMRIAYENETTHVVVAMFFIQEFPSSDFDVIIPANMYNRGVELDPGVRVQFRRVVDAASGP